MYFVYDRRKAAGSSSTPVPASRSNQGYCFQRSSFHIRLVTFGHRVVSVNIFREYKCLSKLKVL